MGQMNESVGKKSSSVVADFKYRDEVLTVRFTSGKEYAYEKVPENVFKDFENAPSKGKFLNSHIKKNYRVSKVA
jgi:hypothetical protein